MARTRTPSKSSGAVRLGMMVLVGALAGPAAAPARSAAGADPWAVPPTSGPAFQRVVSDDGRLTLEVPVAAIPAGVTPTATSVPANLPSVAAYELLPVDISLPGPVMATWLLDPAGPLPETDGDLAWLGLASAADPNAGPWEWLGDPHVDVVGGAYAVTGWLARFGTVIVALQGARIRGPEAIWGPGYELPNRVPVDLDLTLVTGTGAAAAAAFSGAWRFDGGYPDRIDVVQTAATADSLSATWRCLRTGQTSLVSTFGVRETPVLEASARSAPLGTMAGLPPAAAVVSVTFPITCGVQHPGTNR